MVNKSKVLTISPLIYVDNKEIMNNNENVHSALISLLDVIKGLELRIESLESRVETLEVP